MRRENRLLHALFRQNEIVISASSHRNPSASWVRDLHCSVKGWIMSDTGNTEQMFQIPKPKIGLSKGRLLGLKFFLLGALALFLTIPLFMVLALVQEREARFRQSTAEIAQQWGGVQQLTGPLLVIPAVVAENTGAEGSGTKQVDRHLIIVPDTVSAKAQSKTETLSRGIHNATV
jgi:Inner membrane protein CreD